MDQQQLRNIARAIVTNQSCVRRLLQSHHESIARRRRSPRSRVSRAAAGCELVAGTASASCCWVKRNPER